MTGTVKRSIGSHEAFILHSLLHCSPVLPCAPQLKPRPRPLRATSRNRAAVKIAVIAFQAAVTQTNEFQRNFADLQKKYEPKRATAEDAER